MKAPAPSTVLAPNPNALRPSDGLAVIMPLGFLNRPKNLPTDPLPLETNPLALDTKPLPNIGTGGLDINLAALLPAMILVAERPALDNKGAAFANKEIKPIIYPCP